MFGLTETCLAETEDLKQKIKDTKKEIVTSNKEIRYWQEFIDRGQGELDTQIRLLKNELMDMQENYEIISSELWLKIPEYLSLP